MGFVIKTMFVLLLCQQVCCVCVVKTIFVKTVVCVVQQVFLCLCCQTNTLFFNSGVRDEKNGFVVKKGFVKTKNRLCPPNKGLL